MMKVEFEFETSLKDESKILVKASELAKAAKNFGFIIKEIEIESEGRRNKLKQHMTSKKRSKTRRKEISKRR